jgi:two-component sensor histidine kinase
MDVAVLPRPPSDLYITAELEKRSVKNADHLQEKRALQDLAARMVEAPSEVLPRFVELAMQITGGVSSGLSLYEPSPAPGVFRWRYLVGTLSPFEEALTPRDFSPCGITLDLGTPVLSCHPERFYSWISDAGIVVPEVLLVPLHFASAEPLGTLWMVAEKEGHFHAGHARAATELAHFAGIALRMLRTEQQLKNALEEQETVAREMSHRVKNLFTVAQSLVRMTSKTSLTKEQMTESLIGRFSALANAHGLVRRSFGANAESHSRDLKELLRTIVGAHEHHSPTSARVVLSGPPLGLGEQALSGAALVFHELTTNAVKYGALATEDGKVAVEWCVAPDGKVEINWIERGGPQIDSIPDMTGFGSKLLRETVARQFGGTLDHKWHPSGLSVRISLPAAALAH